MVQPPQLTLDDKSPTILEGSHMLILNVASQRLPSRQDTNTTLNFPPPYVTKRPRGRPHGSTKKTFNLTTILSPADLTSSLANIPSAAGTLLKKRQGRPSGTRGRPKGSKNNELDPKVVADLDLSKGRPFRAHAEGFNYNVKLAFRKLAGLGNEENAAWERNMLGKRFRLEEGNLVESELVTTRKGEVMVNMKPVFNSERFAPFNPANIGANETEGSMLLESKEDYSEKGFGSDDGLTPQFPEKKRRGRPKGSRLVDGKLVVPYDHQAPLIENMGSGATERAMEKKKRGRPRKHVTNGLMHGAAMAANSFTPKPELPREKKKLKKSPIVRRSFGGALPGFQSNGQSPLENDSFKEENFDLEQQISQRRRFLQIRSR